MRDFPGNLIRWFRQAAPVEDRATPPELLDRADTAERIELLAQGGFDTEADTFDTIVSEYLIPDEIGREDRRWIGEEVHAAFARKRVEEASWPDVTDVDRLHAAFDELETAGIIALHRAGYTRSDGISDAWEACAQARDGGRMPRGYVFYHGQDVEAAVLDSGLYLAFGAFDERDGTGRSIAGDIVAAVERQGLPVRWDGDVNVRILLWPLAWHKRSPPA